MLKRERFISAGVIQKGDTIRVTLQLADAQISRIGKVAEILETPTSQNWLTAKGVVLLSHLDANDKPRIQLLKEANNGPELEGI